MAFLIGGANTLDSSYSIENSGRWNGSNQRLTRDADESGSSLKATFSAWVKFSTIATEVAMLGMWDDSGANDDDGYAVFKRDSGGTLTFKGGTDTYLTTNAKFSKSILFVTCLGQKKDDDWVLPTGRHILEFENVNRFEINENEAKIKVKAI